jgi:cyclopropane fatty-acyl-phospholipid synthase-like methyltransferase
MHGAPFVGTRNKELISILSQANLKQGQSFLELGCGDGRVIRTAVKKFHVRGTGIDVNAAFILWARFWSWVEGLSGIDFRLGNVKTYSFKDVDVIYMFLLPRLIHTFSDRLAREVDPGTLVISHGFTVPDWEEYLVEKRSSRHFSTYYYKISKTD